MNRRELLHLLAYSGASLAQLGAISSFMSACSGRKFHRSPLRRDRYCVTILVDGWRADLFASMLDSGALPNIKEHLVDRGARVETCVSTFPSTTGPAHLPLINGMMPGYNDCPGLRWVDRSRRKLRDYCTIKNVLFNDDFPRSNHTIYEILNDQRTVCIFDFASRGASDVIRVPAKVLWFVLTHDMGVWDKMDAYAVDAFEKAYLGGGDTPRYTFVWMPALDHLAHFHGAMDTTIVDRALDVDRQVGRIARTLQRAGVYDKTLLSLVADHGLNDTERHVDVRAVLEKYGLKVLDDLTDNDQFNSLHQNNAARGVSGNSFALLYFATRKEGRLGTMSYAWDRPISYEELREFPVDRTARIDLIDALTGEKGIELVIAKVNADTVRVHAGNGTGTIERDWSSLRYSVSGTDPLGFAALPASAALIDGAYHDKDDWFTATSGSSYPDGLYQIVQLFDSSRCGDIIVTAKSGWDLMDQQHIASHGNLARNEIQVPCVVAGPGIKQGTIPVARTVDLFPTYLKYLGMPHYDGEVLNVFL